MVQLETNAPTVEQIIVQAEQARVRHINLQFSDILGVVKSVTVPLSQFPAAIEHGKWFDGSSIEGFARIAESDMFLQPDLSTFAVLPWERAGEGMARVLCWVYSPNGDLFPGDPRVVLQHVLDEARELGYRFNVGPELEFFLFNIDESGRVSALPHDRGSYFDYTTDQAAHVRMEMVNALNAIGIDVETDHHEVAAGQHEIDFRYTDGLRAADNVITARYTLKAIALRNRLHATFMPKPIGGINGSGMHCHQSLADFEGNNCFADESDENGLSELAKYFIAGQLAHARGMSAVLSPLVNSYKRFVPGFEAPNYVSWARFNRSTLIRVPKVRPSQMTATRLELRCPDPSCNPYLAFAVMLKAGLDGIKRQLPLPEPIEENVYQFDESELNRRNIELLPLTLGEALDELRKDEVIQSALGDHVLERFLEAKNLEWTSFRSDVSRWELDRYLENY